MDIPDPPPPPYSETDIYSNGNSNDSTTGADPQSPARSGQGSMHPASSFASSQPQSTAAISSGSQSEVIYTPALSTAPANSVSDSFFPASSSSSAAAQAYFETRPLPTGFFQDNQVAINVTLSSSSRPDDFPYNQEWAGRDVSSSDWHTFLNFLLPNHTTTRNEAIIDRKLLAEEEHASSPSSGSRIHASAQLDQLRRASAAEAAAGSPTASARRDAEAVAAEWNASFFQPRAMWVRLTFEQTQPQRQPERPQMPGTWDHSFDRYQHQQSMPGPSIPPPNQPMLFQPYWTPQQQQQQQQQPLPPSRGGFNFAGIKLNDDGFSIGNTLVADRNGVQVGGLVVDTNGVRYRDNVIAGPGMFSGGPNQGYPGSMYHGSQPKLHQGPPVNAHHPGPTLSSGFPPGPGPLPGSFSMGDPKPFDNRPTFARGPSDMQHPQQHQRRRSESPSGSESSTSSGSSLDSLPEYDDLNASQLPVFHNKLRAWLTQPEKHVTKQDVERLNAELVEAKRTRSEYPPQNIDKRAMRAEIKSLSQEFRALRKAQRGVRRERRREKRARKKAERKERRGQRRGNSFGLGRGRGPWDLPGMPPPGVPLPAPIIGMGPSGPAGYTPSPWHGGPVPAQPFGPPFGYAAGFGGSQSSISPGGPYTAAPQPRIWSVSNDQRQQQPVQTPRAPENPHLKSQEKFNELDELEKELARRCTQLAEAKDGQLKGKQDREKEAVSVKPQTLGDTEPDSAGKQVQTAPDRTRLEEEVDVLTREVMRLRLEADEAFARELEEQERREAGASR